VRQRGRKSTKRLNLFYRLILSWSTGRHVDGLWIGTWEDKPEPILGRVEEALSLIKRYDRVRYDRLLRDLQRVWVILLPSSLGCFNPRISSCEIDVRYLLAETTTPQTIASTIVHEATHARLWHLGFGYDEALRPQIEAICMRRQIAFAAKLPDGAAERDKAERTLPLCDSTDYWTNSAFHRRHLEGSIEAIRYLGMPKWFIRGTLVLHSVVSWFRRGVRSLRPVSTAAKPIRPDPAEGYRDGMAR